MRYNMRTRNRCSLECRKERLCLCVFSLASACSASPRASQSCPSWQCISDGNALVDCSFCSIAAGGYRIKKVRDALLMPSVLR
eukprot:2653746-Pleurochrysis_carterae.AAC.1